MNNDSQNNGHACWYHSHKHHKNHEHNDSTRHEYRKKGDGRSEHGHWFNNHRCTECKHGQQERRQRRHNGHHGNGEYTPVRNVGDSVHGALSALVHPFDTIAHPVDATEDITMPVVDTVALQRTDRSDDMDSDDMASDE